jgi:hypothetical protein
MLLQRNAQIINYIREMLIGRGKPFKKARNSRPNKFLKIKWKQN